MVKIQQQVIGIRCHSFGLSEQNLYNSLLSFFNKDAIFFVVDELKEEKSFPKEYKKISLNVSFIEQNHLYKAHDLAWACGDYFLYAFRQAVQAHYYWLIEPDVLITFQSAQEVFSPFSTVDAEALLSHFVQADPNWAWGAGARLILDPPYSCFFPLTRFSANALDYLLAQRQALSEVYFSKKIGLPRFPNDEAFVVNSLLKGQITPVDLNTILSNAFYYFHTKPYRNKRLAEKYCTNQIIHPVKDVDFYSQKINRFIQEVFNRREFESLVKDLVLDEDEYAELIAAAKTTLEKELLAHSAFKNKVNYTLQRLLLLFKKYFRPVKRRMRFTMHKLDESFNCVFNEELVISFHFSPKELTIYKQQEYPNTHELNQQVIGVHSIGLLDSFDDLCEVMTQTLLAHGVIHPSFLALESS